VARDEGGRGFSLGQRWSRGWQFRPWEDDLVNEVKNIFKSAFALLGVMVVVAVIADRIMDNPAQASKNDSKT
jgi:hypothetical protein